MNMSFLEKNIEKIVKINDVCLPPEVHTMVNLYFPKYKKELFKNQEEFIYKYRHGWYSKENESYVEEEKRLLKKVIEKHPDLALLADDSLDTFEY